MGRVLAVGTLAAGPAATLASGVRAVQTPELRGFGILGIVLASAAAALLATGVVPVP